MASALSRVPNAFPGPVVTVVAVLSGAFQRPGREARRPRRRRIGAGWTPAEMKRLFFTQKECALLGPTPSFRTLQCALLSASAVVGAERGFPRDVTARG